MTAAITADFKTEPYWHQLYEFELSADMPARALLWQMRTGKTKLVIDTACHLYKEGKIDGVLVLAPNGVHENWLTRELPIHHWDTVPHKSLAWRTTIAGDKGIALVKAAERENWKLSHAVWWEKAKAMLTAKELTWYSFNSESMTRDDVRKLVAKIVSKRKCLVVFDESHDYRTPGSKRTKMARAFAKRCPYKRILTGTPVTNSPLHAFSQFELLAPKALGYQTFGDFKDRYAIYEYEQNRKGQQYKVLKEYQRLDEMRENMAPWCSVVRRNDCHDLPDLVRTPRSVIPSDEQLRLYREIHNQFYMLSLDGQEVSIGENTSKLIKLQQILSGFLVDEFGDVYDVPGPNPRLDALSDEVHMASGKVIVWCRFRQDMDRVVARLTADGHEVVQYHGRVSAEEKAKARKLFAPGAENDVKALVGYPTVGLDLSAANGIIWYSHMFDAIMREQADERATAVGGGNVRVIDLIAPGVDEYILDNVLKKVSVAEDLAGTGMQDVLRRIEL